MKHFSKVISSGAIVIIVLLLCSPAYSQNWQLGGNPNPPMNLGNNFLGSSATNNIPIRLGTFGITRLFIQNNTGPTAGFIGINTGTPNQLLTVNSGNVNVQDFILPLIQNNGYMIGNVMTMWRGQTGNFRNIFVGAQAGVVNTTGANNTFVGWQSGISNTTAERNTFIGARAGFNNTALPANANTFIGYSSGSQNTIGNSNTFIGEISGVSNKTGSYNTYLGAYSGENLTSLGNGHHNTFSGYDAGREINSGFNNSITGAIAGYNIRNGNENVINGYYAARLILDGYGNVYNGAYSGHDNQFGFNNVYNGFESGYTESGNTCTYVGYRAGYNGNPTSTPNLINSSALGANAIPNANHKMILGDNNVWVGIGLSNDLTPSFGPQNSLEINARVNGTGVVLPNASGLRFRQLTSSSPTVTNPGLGVLALSSDGDVIYVPENNSNIGGYCGTAIPLSNNFDVPLNGFNYYFSDPAGILNDGVNFVKIGDNCTTPISSKLEVHRRVTNNTQFQVSGSYTLNDDVAQSTILTGYGFGTSGNATGNNRINSGVYGTSSGATTNVGGYFESRSNFVSATVNAENHAVEAFATNAQNNIGVFAEADGSTAIRNTAGSFVSNNATIRNVGVLSTTNGSASSNFGGRFVVSAGVNNNIGVYGSVPGTGATEYAGYFDGDVNINGTITVTTYGPSDQNIKTNIDSLSNALQIINQLAPKSFFFDTLNSHNLNLPSGKQYGLIAQQVEVLLPELVSSTTTLPQYDSLGNITNPSYTFKTLNYNAFIAILMKGMQEQENKIDSLTQTLTDVISTVNSCCNSNHSMQQNGNSTIAGSSIDINLKDNQNIILEQNVPNPFAEQTAINYFLPETVLKAQMLFYNAQGKLIQSVNLNEKGNGSINVFAQDLSNGIYTYTLVVDGKIIETKKMVKQQ